jgi:DNA-binding transcriptional regulator YdaS (Cro superfamily)
MSRFSRVELDQVKSELNKCVDGYGSQKALAAKLGISEAYLSDMLRGNREWSDALLRLVKVERFTIYVRRNDEES